MPHIYRPDANFSNRLLVTAVTLCFIGWILWRSRKRSLILIMMSGLIISSAHGESKSDEKQDFSLESDLHYESCGLNVIYIASSLLRKHVDLPVIGRTLNIGANFERPASFVDLKRSVAALELNASLLKADSLSEMLASIETGKVAIAHRKDERDDDVGHFFILCRGQREAVIVLDFPKQIRTYRSNEEFTASAEAKLLSLQFLLVQSSNNDMRERKGPRIRLKSTEVNFGEVLPGSTPLVGELEYQNDGTELLKIENVVASCGCTKVQFDKEVPSGGSGRLKIEIDRGAVPLGQNDKELLLLTNDAAAKVIKVHVIFRLLDPASTDTAVKVVPMSIELGRFKISTRLPQETIVKVFVPQERLIKDDVSMEPSYDGNRFSVKNIASSDWVDSAGKKRGKLITVNLVPASKFSPGEFEEKLILTLQGLKGEQGRKVMVPVRGDALDSLDAR